jgi:hypothetical protein
MHSGHLQALSDYCRSPVDANRQQACQTLSRHLLSRAGNLVELSIGVSVAARSGLDPARVAEARAELDSLTKAAALPTAHAAHSSNDCTGLASIIKAVERRIELGEVEALREQALAGPRR